ncbi:UDP-N-acetylglucosamine-peptide N-acetylglucosaminyltransferase [Actinoplanes sp. SE50]|uniref:tetratricopeptide repeat protein n=1 Tax=unclassified Actinoplanes TaxID=2626549 RepID=UPI00023ECA5A|nr:MULTISPECIES: tetratricopeptide repeat protein [unclassified Actinoplanes]AEV81494.1 UDP-N-acetylglucosamine-peptide N-acetylglucosaminyltransferase 110 kDa subunit [Actinoplanes sp. SE50/110]ATO79897.1 UDP-N-acetylglucosamine-peptide N-acetylglucosaminyltransferase [Actinoplanes sp. SE50]SLL97299.1 UDP-N-acetylglucosamine-peptideN-acetylglucosaminyltransferase [Actinoplanes sp. SE50/110]
MTTAQPIAMARLQLQRGEAQAAAELLGPVLAAEPDHVTALVLMTHAQLALEKPDLAHEVAARAVRYAPGSAEALTALSRTLTALGRHDEAIATAQAATARQPENPYRHNRLAWALLEQGLRPVEAEHAAREAVRLDPDEADFRITYAMVMKQLNLPERAREALRDALRIAPDNAIARHELAAFDVVHRNPFALRRLARGVTGLVAALRADPRQEASRHLLDAALRQFLTYAAVMMGVFAYLGWRVAGESAPWARVLAGAAFLVPAAYASYFVARLDRVLKTYLREVVNRHRAASVAAAVTLALLLTATVAPAAWLPALLGLACLAGFIVRLLSLTVNLRNRRRPPK